MGTLVVFVTMVLVASIAAGVLINTVGIAGPADGDPADGPATARVLVISEAGTVAADGSVGTVNLTVTTAPDADPVDLRDVTVTWVGPNGVYNVASTAAAGGSSDGTFAITAMRNPNDSGPVLDEAGDRMVLSIDVGERSLREVEPIGANLGPGDVVSLTLTTADGETTTTRLAVPRSTGRDGQVVL